MQVAPELAFGAMPTSFLMNSWPSALPLKVSLELASPHLEQHFAYTAGSVQVALDFLYLSSMISFEKS